MADKRANIILRCKECKHENYITTKNKKAHPDRFSTTKYTFVERRIETWQT